MKREQRERLVDDVLDRALGPQLVEPRAGLEERILANLPAQPERRPWWQWMWIPALAAAAVLAVVIGMRILQKEQPAPVQVQEKVEQQKREVAVKPVVPVAKGQQPRVIAKHAHPRTIQDARAQVLPRQNVFPAPVPLTEQERLLLALVNRQRPQAELLAAEQQAEREKVQKYFETGEAPVAQPTPAQPMR